MNVEPKIVSISVCRLFNLGNYEHVKYELSAICGDGDAGKVLTGIERILEALRPNRVLKSQNDIAREQSRVDELKKMPLAEFQRRIGDPVGGPAEYIKRVEDGLLEDRRKLEVYQTRQKRARELLNDLGGAAEYKDAKLDWDTDCL